MAIGLRCTEPTPRRRDLPIQNEARRRQEGSGSPRGPATVPSPAQLRQAGLRLHGSARRGPAGPRREAPPTCKEPWTAGPVEEARPRRPAAAAARPPDAAPPAPSWRRLSRCVAATITRLPRRRDSRRLQALLEPRQLVLEPGRQAGAELIEVLADPG